MRVTVLIGAVDFNHPRDWAKFGVLKFADVNSARAAAHR